MLAIFLYKRSNDEKIQKYDAASLDWQMARKAYINNIGKFSIEYPGSWALNESHTVSNRVVDNPNEINTAIFTGKEGEIVIEWGPMGFGGGCNTEDHKMFSIKNKTMNICEGIDEQGNKYWGGIENDHNDDSAAAVTKAVAYKPVTINAKVIEEILSTLTFN